MDFLHFDPECRVLVCTRCQYAIPLDFLAGHLQEQHHKDLKPQQRLEYAACFDALPIQDPKDVAQIQPPLHTPPIPYLTLYNDGICCRLCAGERPYICRNEQVMVQHLKAAHRWRRRKGQQHRLAPRLRDVTWSPIACQTFHRCNYFRFFPVDTGAPLPSAATIAAVAAAAAAAIENHQPIPTPPKESLQDKVKKQLTQKQEAIRAAQAEKDAISRHPTEVSRWLDLTRWEEHLAGHSLRDAQLLIELPYQTDADPANAHLCLLLDSFDRLIEDARMSLKEGRLNIFDQHLINNFLGRRANSRPLWYKLQETTYTAYKRVWKQLLCFVYRLAQQKQGPCLHFSLTDAQADALHLAVRAAESVEEEQQRRNSRRRRQRQVPTRCLQDLDFACLQLCIALLDHALYGSIYDSIVVGFLAVLGISPPSESDKEGSQGGRFLEATLYTTKLSAFVKCAQLLVLQRAVVAAERKEVDYPATILEVMHQRFMMTNTRSPVDWAQKLRAYGKKIQDTTTALGHIVWSDDGEELEYKGLKLSMAGLRRFLTVQQQAADRQLDGLLFSGPSIGEQEQEQERDIDAAAAVLVPTVDLSQLKDDPANGQPGWSFLKDPRNSSLLQGRDEWLLNCVLEQKRLQKRFFTSCKDARWRRQAVKDYLAQADAFLERLLLLIHITAGQPARGTELLSLQCCNTKHGLRRNIFLENGLVSFVTFYHKGYSVSGSVKIIHRYLPKDVSRLLVYYLWLVQPFCEQLRILALNEKPNPLSFLWSCAKEATNVPWLSPRLAGILAREFKEHLDTEAAILLWRHAAIAISRRHLRQAKFNKDYGLEISPTWNDEQAGHPSHLASTIYARGIEEAPGHIAAARAEYRQISREWHTFLGLGDDTSSSKVETGAAVAVGAAVGAAVGPGVVVGAAVEAGAAVAAGVCCKCGLAKAVVAAEAGLTLPQPTKTAPPLQQTAPEQTSQQQTPQQTPRQQTTLLQKAPRAVPNNLRLYMSPDQQAMFMARIKQEETGDKELPPARGQLKRKALSEVPLNRVAKWPRGDGENGECRTRDR
jgi:hypothetical protein